MFQVIEKLYTVFSLYHDLMGGTGFLYMLFQQKLGRTSKLLMIFTGLLAVISLFPLPFVARAVILYTWEISLILYLYLAIRVFIPEIKAGKREAQILFIGLIVIFLTGGIDIFLDNFTGQDYYLVQYGFLFMLTLASFSISYQNARAQSELEIVNSNLEMIVQERTAEISRQNGILQQEFHMASILQSKLIPDVTTQLKSRNASAFPVKTAEMASATLMEFFLTVEIKPRILAK